MTGQIHKDVHCFTVDHLDLSAVNYIDVKFMDSIYIIKLIALELQFSLITCMSAFTLTSVLVWNSCTHLLHRMDQFIQTWHKVFLHCTRREFIWIFNNFKEMANLLKGEIVMVKRGCLGISLLQDPLHKECQKKLQEIPQLMEKILNF